MRLEFKKQEEEKNFQEGNPDQEHCCGGQAGGYQLYFMAGQLCCLADQIFHTENNYESANIFLSIIMAVALMEWRQIFLTIIIIVVETNEVEGFRGMEFSNKIMENYYLTPQLC